MSAKREYLWPAIAIAAVALGAFVLLLRTSAEDAAVRVGFERQALERLRRVADAERILHEREGRYGPASALSKAGLIEAAWLGPEGSIQSPRYRIDVLLPHGLSPGGFVQLAPGAVATSQRKLAQRHFAVVARPWGEERTGHRSFYIDETGQVYLTEGAAHAEGGLEPPLPEFHLAQSKQLDSRGRRWWPLESAMR